jgi:hypothetical protein
MSRVPKCVVLDVFGAALIFEKKVVVTNVRELCSLRKENSANFGSVNRPIASVNVLL